MKQFIKDVFGRLGYDLHRKCPAFQPFLEHFPLAGVEFSFWIGDAVAQDWYRPEGHKAAVESTAIAQLVRPGDRVLEIGAHHGFHSMLLSRLVGDHGFVLAVEPSPFNAMMAAAQVGLNRAANCRVLLAAASDQAGRIKISRESDATVTDSADGLEVDAITVDELDSTFGPFNSLKVDVEGYERQVLAGATKLLQRRPGIMLELHSPLLSRFGSTVEEVLNLLGPTYEGSFMPRGTGGWNRLCPFPGEPLPSNEIVNLFLTSHRAVHVQSIG